MHWWSREFARQGLALVPTPLYLFVPAATPVRLLVFWDLYAVGYLLLTLLAYARREPAELRRMAVASRRGTGVRRLLGVSPGQLSQAAATVALMATVSVMPRAGEFGLPGDVVLAICVVAVVTAWLTLQVGFAVVYLGRWAAEGGLDFPGHEAPVFTDLLYFSVAVGTSFGTTDVVVTRRSMRRTVLVHGMLAFLFNALIIAGSVSIFSSLAG
ncbi:DUF1345 domain-containing protein [Pseudonocardia sp. HH130630-07]|uniref:DUF1345 domain-containing protein n=1 Tax=Pseudonocardia sp. HH130630-07 TaxID=1690815 RepID=UPI0018D2B1D8|nr:DUF1345 domain-containing protein [Pseudonocardia sp. HH130630-07]